MGAGLGPSAKGGASWARVSAPRGGGRGETLGVLRSLGGVCVCEHVSESVCG